MHEAAPGAFKTARLKEILAGMEKPLSIACSGGLDSRFLAHFALLCGIPAKEIQLFHGVGPHIPEDESLFLRSWATRQELPLREITFSPFFCPEIARNTVSRCYFCKRELFLNLQKLARTRLCDGTHADDVTGVRPGLRALQELGIHSPLAEAGMTKADIRRMARESALENPGQKARPCLLTRFPYDTPVTEEMLRTVARMEKIVHEVLAAEYTDDSFPDFRVRMTGSAGFCLHTLVPLGEDTVRALQSRLAGAILPSISLQVLQTLSGYFDTHRNP